MNIHIIKNSKTKQFIKLICNHNYKFIETTSLKSIRNKRIWINLFQLKKIKTKIKPSIIRLFRMRTNKIFQKNILIYILIKKTKNKEKLKKIKKQTKKILFQKNKQSKQFVKING